MDYIKLKEKWVKEENTVLKGWDFSYLNGRWNNIKPIEWDYSEIVKRHLCKEDILLDMGTGGGEFLLTLNHPYNLTHVTESYIPNVEICKKELAPLGINVKQVFNDNNLPFADNSFDIIINRQTYFDVNEVERILKPDGIFITQQVGNKNSVNLREHIMHEIIDESSTQNLKNNVNAIINKGFEIIFQKECFPKTHFYDVGAIVYFAKAIVWEFPKFSVDEYLNELCELENKIIEEGFVENAEHRFVIVAKKIKL